MTTQYPVWKSCLLWSIGIFSLIYAIPNLFIEQPILQITSVDNVDSIQSTLKERITQILQSAQLSATTVRETSLGLVLTFQEVDTQLKAKEKLTQTLGDQYSILVNLSPTTPRWLRYLGAHPMKLGLDLRGGIHLVLALDTAHLQEAQLKKWFFSVTDSLRQANIRYISAYINAPKIQLVFDKKDTQQIASTHLLQRFPDFTIQTDTLAGQPILTMQFSKKGVYQIQQQAMTQTLRTLHSRVNELGVSEPFIYSQGEHHIVVDLPGIQDMARAQQMLGNTATIAFHLVQDESSATPLTGKQYHYHNHPITLAYTPDITGEAIIDAHSDFDIGGKPTVNITLSKAVESHLHQVTHKHIGQLMAIVYKQTNLKTQIIEGKPIPKREKSEKVISVAHINSALGRHFQITGLSQPESQDLALLLRTGTLPVPIYMTEQTTIGPQLGLENIRLGLSAIIVSFLIAALFMGIYYRQFGWIANLVLLINFSLLIASLSILGTTLTLPGIAGILLTVALAVDAQVLIFERIREERRRGLSPRASIMAGYVRAWTTILDSNMATLIIAYMLFSIGSGAIRGFAVTLALGIFTSMLSAVGFSRALVAYFYNTRLKQLPIE